MSFLVETPEGLLDVLVIRIRCRSMLEIQIPDAYDNTKASNSN